MQLCHETIYQPLNAGDKHELQRHLDRRLCYGHRSLNESRSVKKSGPIANISE
ncbi:MAG: hypothetical protein M0019_07120 [Actinomycetota bacterium]|nr:hypothetical protein [Actinomycetota bacterium]